MTLSEQKKFALGVGFILLAQVIILPRTAPAFFDGDAFFYFAHHLNSWEDFKKCILQPDTARQYRPLGQILFSYFFYPIFRLDYTLYGNTALAFHMANTILAFLIFKRLLKSTVAVISATIFWGLHPVAIYVTHSFSFLADFTFVFFYFLAIYFYLKYVDTGKLSFGIGVLISFVISITCKEAAVTLPAALFFLAVGFLSDDVQPSVLKSRSRWLFFLMFGGLAVYVAAYFWMKGGRLYDTGDLQNYYFNFSFKTFLEKMEYLLAGFFMPFPENQDRPGAVVDANKLALFTFPFILVFFIFLVWPQNRRSNKIWLGFFLFFLLMMPVLFIRPKEFMHNIYLPIVGLAIATGIFLDDFSKTLKETLGLNPKVFYLYALAIVLSSLLVNQEIFKKINWRPSYEKIANAAIDGLQRLHPKLQHGSILYFLRSPVQGFPWLVYDGLFFKVFRKDPSLTSRFQEWDEPFPFKEAQQGKAFALVFTEGTLYDMTKDYLDQVSNVNGINLLNSFDQASVYIPHSVGDASELGTPENKVAFIATTVRNHEARIAMVSLGLTKVRFHVPDLTSTSRLILGTAMQYDIGDGAEGRVYFESGDKRTLVYSRYIDPARKPEDRVWFDDVVPLGQFAGSSGTLIFECYPGPAGNADADWFLWSRMRIERGNPSTPIRTQ